jgi:ATP-dependent protease ClpP protease subunit
MMPITHAAVLLVVLSISSYELIKETRRSQHTILQSRERQMKLIPALLTIRSQSRAMVPLGRPRKIIIVNSIFSNNFYPSCMEIWFTFTGDIKKEAVQEAIQWINGELYSKPVKRLKFLIASSGGDIDSGVNLHMYLKALPVDVETIGFGKVDAAAIPIFLGGTKRFAVQGCQFFFHEGRYTIGDQTAPIHVHEEAVSIFKRNLHETIYIIARETGNDTEVVANMLRRSKIMTAQEALEFGLCHEIIAQLPLRQQEQVGFGFQGSDAHANDEVRSRPLAPARRLRAESEADPPTDQER